MFLLLVGSLLAVVSFAVVLAMPVIRPDANDLTARAQLVAGGEPGFTFVLQLLGGSGSDSAWRIAAILLAVVIATPLIWLPLAVARTFHRARAGYALVLLPPLMWLLNNGTILSGTEYGIIDEVTGSRVPLPLGFVGSVVFLGLSVTLILSTYRLSRWRLMAATALVLVVAGIASMFGLLPGVVVAASVTVLWWRNLPRGRRAFRSVLAGLLVCAAAIGINYAVAEAAPPQSAVFADDLGNGLTYPAPILDLPSATGITLADTAAGTPDLFSQTFEADPAGVVVTTAQKALATLKHYGAMIIVIVLGFVLALTRRAHQSRSLFSALMIAGPALVVGLLYASLTMPVVHNFALISAGLSFLVALSLGAIVWSVTSMPAHVRSVERGRVRGRLHIDPSSTVSTFALSVVVPTRNGADVLPETLSQLGSRLGSDDQIIIVENGSTDDTTAKVNGIIADWSHPSTISLIHSSPGLGEALRTGALASAGKRLLLTADDLPFGFTDLDEFKKLPVDVTLAIGSKAHPASIVVRSRMRTVQSRVFRFLRASLLQSNVGDSQGTLWVDGAWGREFARQSREAGLMWTTEMVLAAEQQNHEVAEVPVALVERHEVGSSRFRAGDAVRSVIGFVRLAIYKDDYCNEEWERSTRPEPSSILD